MSNKPKIKFGLKNVYYAPMVETVENGVTTVTYQTPKPWKGAVNLALSPTGESSSFYADDTEYANLTSNQGYEGDFESAMIPDDVQIDVLDNDEVDDVIIESAENQGKLFALLFEIANDVKARRYVFYRCNLSTRPSVESNTKTDSTEPVTDKVTLKATPRTDVVNVNGVDKHLVKAVTTESTSSEIYNSWYNDVWTPGTSTP